MTGHLSEKNSQKSSRRLLNVSGHTDKIHRRDLRGDDRTIHHGEYLDGCTSYGEDALMSPDKFADRFQHICFGFGYREAEIIPMKHEIKEWCQEHLDHLESKFR